MQFIVYIPAQNRVDNQKCEKQKLRGNLLKVTIYTKNKSQFKKKISIKKCNAEIFYTYPTT